MKERPYIIRNEALRGTVLQLIMGLDISKPWRVTVEPYRKSRSVEQNRLYWKILQLAADELGCDAEGIHDVARKKFLPPVFTEIKGEVHEGRPSTTKLNVGEFSDYIERVTAWLQVDLGLVLPMDDRYAA
jgi:hypothetical protein